MFTRKRRNLLLSLFKPCSSSNHQWAVFTALSREVTDCQNFQNPLIIQLETRKEAQG